MKFGKVNRITLNLLAFLCKYKPSETLVMSNKANINNVKKIVFMAFF